MKNKRSLLVLVSCIVFLGAAAARGGEMKVPPAADLAIMVTVPEGWTSNAHTDPAHASNAMLFLGAPGRSCTVQINVTDEEAQLEQILKSVKFTVAK